VAGLCQEDAEGEETAGEAVVRKAERLGWQRPREAKNSRRERKAKRGRVILLKE
jgi:hypothetical protein